jgi:adenylate cyclase
MKGLLALAFCLLSSVCFAQDPNPKIDSLKNLLPLLTDSMKVKTLIDMGMMSLGSDLNASVRYGTEAKQLAQETGYKKGEGNALKLLGIASSNQGNISQANIQFSDALAIFESINDKDGMASMLNNLGNLSNGMGEYSKAIDYHLRSLKIAEEVNNKLREGTALMSIGLDYSAQPDGDETAIRYYRKALPIFEELKYENGIGTTSINIGEIYYRKGKNDSALYYFKSAIRIYQGTKDSAMPLTYVADIFSSAGNYDSAFHFHHQAIEISEKLGVQLYLAQSLLGLAKTYMKKNDLSNSIETYKKALAISESIKARQEMRTSYEALADGYATLGDYKNAYLYRSKLTLLKDTLFNSDEAKKIQQMQFNFDIEKAETQIQLQGATIERQRIISYAIGVSGFLLLLLAAGSYQRYKFIRKTNKIIQNERDRSKSLLLNILPEETANELETKGFAQTRFYESVSVLFTDFKGFSSIAGKLSPQELVAELNDYFVAFDEIVERHGLEKIKTIGDAYMCAGGIPVPNQTHPLNALEAALEMQEFMTSRNEALKAKGLQGWELRIGIHTGPIVAGVVGKKKYAYDIWGDTVNIASRMESNGEPGKVNISAATYQLTKDKYQCLYRGKISAKNIGEVDMYFVDSRMAAPVRTAV